MARVRRTLGLPTSTAPREQQRPELLDRKLTLGHHGLHKRIGRGLWWSEKVTRCSVAMARGKRRFSVCEIEVATGSAEQFARWFEDRNTLNNEAAAR